MGIKHSLSRIATSTEWSAVKALAPAQYTMLTVRISMAKSSTFGCGTMTSFPEPSGGVLPVRKPWPPDRPPQDMP